MKAGVCRINVIVIVFNSKAKYADRPTSHTCEPLAPCQ